MASSSTPLCEAHLSKVTGTIPADKRLKFAVEYLSIEGNEYKTIESDAKSIHHDTLFECLRRWKNRAEAEGNNAKDELIRILIQIRKEHGWFSGHDMAFLTDVSGMQIPESSKICYTYCSFHGQTNGHCDLYRSKVI